MVAATAPNLSVAGVRQRRWRERQKFPLRAVAQVEYERDAVTEALISSGRLSITDISNRERIALALRVVISEWANWTNQCSTH